MAGTQSPQLVNVVVLKEGEADDVSFIRTVISSILAATVQHNTAYLAGGRGLSTVQQWGWLEERLPGR